MTSEPKPDGDVEEVAGFNSEVLSRGATFHVQTENLGEPDDPTVNTLIFLRGALVHKISTSYEPPDGPDLQIAALQAHLKKQHTAAISRVKRGEFGSR